MENSRVQQLIILTTQIVLMAGNIQDFPACDKMTLLIVISNNTLFTYNTSK